MSLPIASDAIKCMKHQDRDIEFYCKGCKTLICSRCMFHEHNGHQLCLLEDALDYLMDHLDDLESAYNARLKRGSTNTSQTDSELANSLKKIDQFKTKQINYIRHAFDAAIESLLKRKEALIDQTTERYDQEKLNLNHAVKSQVEK